MTSMEILDRADFTGGNIRPDGAGKPDAARSFLHRPDALDLGDYRLSVVSDGFISLPDTIVAPEGNAAERADLAVRLGGANGIVPIQANIPLLQRGNDLILIDTGSGTSFQETAGRLRSNLQAAGLDLSDITKIIFTHAHPDHMGGVVLPDGSPAFPNAEYYISAAERDFWMSDEVFSRLPAAWHVFAHGAQQHLSAIADRTHWFSSNQEILPFIRAIETPGHTPGHMSIAIESGEGLLVSGDAIPSDIFSLEHPEWHFGNDTMSELALLTRRALIERAAADRLRLLGYHWSYPGIGFVERRGKAFSLMSE